MIRRQKQEYKSNKIHPMTREYMIQRPYYKLYDNLRMSTNFDRFRVILIFN